MLREIIARVPKGVKDRLAFLRPVAARMLARVEPVPAPVPLFAQAAYEAVMSEGSPSDVRRYALKLDPSKTPNGILINVGMRLVEQGDLDQGIAAFRAAYRQTTDAKYSFGQKLLDFVVGAAPEPDVLIGLVEGLGKAPDIMVEDLARAILRQMLAKPEANFPRPVLRRTAAYVSSAKLLQDGSDALSAGKHAQAIAFYLYCFERNPQDLLTRLQLGVTHYLAAEYEEAERHFAVIETLRASEQQRWGVAATPVRILHDTWLQAVGHIACLDTYLKAERLGWLPPARSILTFSTKHPPAGWRLLKYWSDYIDVVGVQGDPGPVIDKMIFGEEKVPLDDESKSHRRISLMHYFWAGKNGEGRTRWFAPWGADVQRAWKAQGRAPLLELDQDERRQFRMTMEQSFGLPHDAWYVMLHVREPGFNPIWERNHGYTRNARIETYEAAIDYIRSLGGWVVRGGDPSMTALEPREGVIDYAASPFRSHELDIQLCAECHFFLGTNSGFSLVPPLFGKRCVLTNWSPLATPNWYPDDIFIPKLVRQRATGEWLSFWDMYQGAAGWSQWSRDFQDEFEKIDNDPEDIVAATREMYERLKGEFELSVLDKARIARFEATTLEHGGFLGSRIGAAFLEKYEYLLRVGPAEPQLKALEPPAEPEATEPIMGESPEDAETALEETLNGPESETPELDAPAMEALEMETPETAKRVGA